MSAGISQRIVITGLGVVSPIGIGREEFWKNLVKGKDGVSDVKLFDTSLYKTHRGAEVKNFHPQDYIRRISLPSCCRSAQLAVAASRLAASDAGLTEDFIASVSDRIGVIIGSTTVDPSLGEEYVRIWAKEGYSKIPESLVRTHFDWFTAGLANSVACELGFRGLSMSIPTACAAGNYTIGYAFDLLEAGRLDIVFAGGSDPMNQLVFAGFNRFRAMAPDKCMPFDLERKGLIVGEGSGILVLETLEHALKRKAHVYAQVLGYGIGCDAYHPTGLHPEGKGVVAAIDMALKKAKIDIREIDYINAHGTATPLNDKIETKVIKKIFGRRAKAIPVSSIKSMIGHTMGAASAIEAAACALIVEENIIPPTINYKTPDPDCDLDYVPNKARRQKVDIALSNSFGFGGNIGVLLIKKFYE